MIFINPWSFYDSDDIPDLNPQDEDEAMKKELEYIRNTTEKQMYINDLTKLRKELEKDFN